MMTSSLAVCFSGPNSYAKCQIEPEGANRFAFSYVPLEVGQFNITLKWNNRELAGSPYRVRVSVHWRQFM